MVDRVPAEEWAEVFREAWRRYRDFFYVENMNGYDWEALRRQYEPLLAYAGHRSDVNYIIGEMIAELNNSHAYVAGGDFGLPPRPEVALPGARFELDKAAGRYRIARIFAGHNEEETLPLAPDRDRRRRAAGRLRAGDRRRGARRRRQPLPPAAPQGRPAGAHDGQCEAHGRRRPRDHLPAPPIRDRSDLSDWIEGNRERVTKLSDGRLGYIHIPDMGDDGFREFASGTSARSARRDWWSTSATTAAATSRPCCSSGWPAIRWPWTTAAPTPTPSPIPAVFYGPMACLLNEGSASDGDIFPYMFRELGLGPADRHPHLGRRGGHLRPRPDDRRRPDLRPRGRLRVAGRENGSSKGTASIPTSWCENDVAVGARRPRPPARTGRRRGDEEAGGRSQGLPEAPGAARADPAETVEAKSGRPGGNPGRSEEWTDCKENNAWRSTRSSAAPRCRRPAAGPRSPGRDSRQ